MKHSIYFVLVLFVSAAILTAQEPAQIALPLDSPKVPTFKDGEDVFLAVKGNFPRLVIYQSPVGKDEFNDKGFSNDFRNSFNAIPYDEGIDIRIWSRKGKNHEVMRVNAKELLDDLQDRIRENPNDKTKWKTARENELGKVSFAFTGTVAGLFDKEQPSDRASTAAPAVEEPAQTEPLEVPTFKNGLYVFLAVKGSVPRMVIYQSPAGKNEFSDKGFPEVDGYGDNLVPYDNDIDIRIWTRKGTNREAMHINAKELLDNLQTHIKGNPNDQTKWETMAENEFGKATFTYAGNRNFYDLVSDAEEPAYAPPRKRHGPFPVFSRLSHETVREISSGDVYLLT